MRTRSDPARDLQRTPARNSAGDRRRVGANDGAIRMKMLTGLLRLRQTCCDLRLLGLPPNEQARDIGQARSARRAAGGDHRWRASRSRFQPVRQDARSHPGTAGGERNRILLSRRPNEKSAARGRSVSSGRRHSGLPHQSESRRRRVESFCRRHGDPFRSVVECGGRSAGDRSRASHRPDAGVTSYKLIARDTVEEKILNLQKRKREMASAMLETEEPLMTGLTTADLAELLAS